MWARIIRTARWYILSRSGIFGKRKAGSHTVKVWHWRSLVLVAARDSNGLAVNSVNICQGLAFAVAGICGRHNSNCSAVHPVKVWQVWKTQSGITCCQGLAVAVASICGGQCSESRSGIIYGQGIALAVAGTCGRAEFSIGASWGILGHRHQGGPDSPLSNGESKKVSDEQKSELRILR